MRLTQRDILPKSIKNRLLGSIVLLGADISGSNVLAAGDSVLYTITTSMKDNPRVLALPDISLFQDSVSAANRIPTGANITASDYQIIGPFNDWGDTDDFNVKTKVFIRNALSPNTTFTKRVGAGTEDGYKITGSAWTTAGNVLLGKGGSVTVTSTPGQSTDDGTKFSSSGWVANANSIAIGNSLGEDCTLAIRFPNITIPQGATISAATITFKVSFGTVDTITTTIRGIDEDNTTTFSSDPTGRTTTSASAAWVQAGATTDQSYATPSLVTIAQEIVDRAGWASGNAMGFLIPNNGSPSDDFINFYAWDHSGTDEGILSITYAGGASITAGLRFPSVTIPQGATITSAKITFTATATDGDTISVGIYGIDEDDTASLSSDPTGRATTTAGVNWTEAGVTLDQAYDTSDITTVIQEIVNRAGWASGNAMGFLIEDDTTANGNQLSFYGYDNSTTKAPLLTIVYNTPNSSRTVLIRAAPRGIVNIPSFI